MREAKSHTSWTAPAGLYERALKGFVETAMTAELPEARQDAYRAAIPLARFALPDEVAAAVQFLASADAGYISGAVIPVDGGLGMGH